MSVSPFYYGFYDAQLERNGGTSAASPVWAGIIGLLNAARLKAGKSAIGFFNPLLYNSGYTVMTDITKGQSVGCNGQDTQTGANGTFNSQNWLLALGLGKTASSEHQLTSHPVIGAGIIPFATWNGQSWTCSRR